MNYQITGKQPLFREPILAVIDFDFIGVTGKDVRADFTLANLNELETLRTQAGQVICK
jgi:hypothetical protein